MLLASLAPIVALPWLQGFFSPTPVFDAVVAYRLQHEVLAHHEDLLASAVGETARGEPLIAAATTSGTSRDSSTVLTLYRVRGDGAFAVVFSAAVEDHARSSQDATTRTGIVTLIPGGLIYRDPSGIASLWLYDTVEARYVEQRFNAAASPRSSV